MVRYKKKSTESYQKDSLKFLMGDQGRSDVLMSKQAKRTQVIDRDNSIYTDYCLGNGALILGHANRNVVLGIKKIAERGVKFDTITSEEIILGKQIVQQIPSVDKVCFFESYEQTLTVAIEVAKTHTQKEIIVTFDLCRCAKRAKDSVLCLPFNDTQALEAAVEQHKNNISCIVLEAVSTRWGVVAAQEEFLSAIKTLTQKYGILLVLDEHVTGFRTCSEGAQKDFSLMPDFVCLSGIIGGGFPLSALGVRQKIVKA